MLLNSIFSYNSVEMIITSLINRFSENDEFIDNVWNALEFCSRLQEKEAV